MKLESIPTPLALLKLPLVCLCLSATIAIAPVRSAFAGAVGPALSFDFDEGSGTTALNAGSLGAGSDGIISNATYSADTPSGAGFSLFFDGDTDFVETPDTFDYGDQLTVEAWIKPDALDGQRAIYDDYGNPGVFLAIVNGQLQFNLSTAANPNQGISIFAGLLCTGVWQHVAGTYDGSLMRAYINGVQVGTVSTSGDIMDNSGNATHIGADSSTPNLLEYAGRIDDLRVFLSVLAPEELGDGLAISNTPGQCLDVRLVKLDDPDPVTVGESLKYSFQIRVLGNDPAPDVVLTDTLPPSMSFVSALSSQGTFDHNSGVVTFQLGTVTNNTTASADIFVTPTQAGIITNVASVSTSGGDELPANNEAFVVTTVQEAGTDLSPLIENTDISCANTDPGSTCSLTGELSLRNSGVAFATAQIDFSALCKKCPEKLKWKLAGFITLETLDLTGVPDHSLAIYLSNDDTLDDGDTLLVKKPIGILGFAKAFSGGKPIKVKTKMPSDTDLAGKYLILVQDSDDAVNESNETNNAVAIGPVS